MVIIDGMNDENRHLNMKHANSPEARKARFPQQLEAGRRDGQKATGPVTPAGRDGSARPDDGGAGLGEKGLFCKTKPRIPPSKKHVIFS